MVGRFIAAFEKIADAHDRQAEAMTDIAERMRGTERVHDEPR